MLFFEYLDRLLDLLESALSFQLLNDHRYLILCTAPQSTPAFVLIETGNFGTQMSAAGVDN